jgi:hypothetical protein
MSKTPTRAEVTDHYLDSVGQVIQDFDVGKYPDFRSLLEAFYHAGLKKGGAPVAVRLEIGEAGTLEFRFMRSQRSFREMIAMMMFFRAVLNHLKADPGVVWQRQRRSFNPIRSDGQFRRMVKMVGLNWEEYRTLLPLWRQGLLRLADAVRGMPDDCVGALAAIH